METNKKDSTNNTKEIITEQPPLKITLNEENIVPADNIDINRVISVFGEDNIRDTIQKITGSDKVLSFTYSIDNREKLCIKRTLLHSMDTAAIRDLILSTMIWNGVKDIWDSDNDTYMYPHMVSIEDVSGNNVIVYDGEKIYFNFNGANVSVTPYELYELVYAKYNEVDHVAMVEKWKDKLELDKVRANYPHLSGFQYYLTMDDVKEISKIYKQLGISLIAMGDYSNAAPGVRYQYIILLVD